MPDVIRRWPPSVTSDANSRSLLHLFTVEPCTPNRTATSEVVISSFAEPFIRPSLGTQGARGRPNPVYLKRWTRMGQARDGILESLLLLGEPEAVVAVVNAAGITDELASRAWWSVQTAENARCMLQQPAVVEGRMGPVLAEFLLEFLPFEEEPRDQIRSVRLVLQGDLISTAERERLWEKGRHRELFLRPSARHIQTVVAGCR